MIVFCEGIYFSSKQKQSEDIFYRIRHQPQTYLILIFNQLRFTSQIE